MNQHIYSIDEIKKIILPLAEEYGIEKMTLFGSYARGTANSDSDIDFRIDKGKLKGLEMGGLYADLEDHFQKSIDLITTTSLSPDFLDVIAKEEVLLYGK